MDRVESFVANCVVETEVAARPANTSKERACDEREGRVR
jgi:hypothetical protein